MVDLAAKKSHFTHQLELFLQKNTPVQPDSIYQYCALPTGKLFRPSLVYCLAADLNSNTSTDSDYLALAIELHHIYSLVHDDLPSMDNDDMRRGKPSAHKQYTEWQAILAGDGFINLSYRALANIRSSNLANILSFFSWAVGPKGLVHGQELDLKSDDDFQRVHELKTGRLMQVACVGCAYLSERKDIKNFLKLGSLIGITFQLQDDLDDINEEASPYFKSIEETHSAFIAYKNKLYSLLDNLELAETKIYLDSFLKD